MAKTILTADDSASMRQMIRFVLTQGGYEVVEAVDGADALAKLSASNIDMLITDLNMPRLDGVGLIKEVRGRAGYRFTPIIMLSTESSEEKKAAGKAAGATGWITKPFTPEQLLAVIRKVLR